MICPPCQRAGALNKTNNQKYNSTRKRRILLWHSKCKGGCDCQHVIGKVVRTENVH